MMKKNKKRTAKQVVALGCVIFICLMSVISLILAFLSVNNKGLLTWFGGTMGLTLALPIFAWIYLFLYGKLSGKKTIADMDVNVEDRDADDTSLSKEMNHTENS